MSVSTRRRPYLIALCLLILLGAAGNAAAHPAQLGTTAALPKKANACVQHRHIDRWSSTDQLAGAGFNIDMIGSQASLTVQGAGRDSYLSFDLASNPSSTLPVASRITEIESDLPIDARVRCWQARSNHNVVAEYIVRFDQAATPPGLTENLLLWNAPLPAPGSGETPRLLTAIGVTRSMNAPYSAAVAQDLNTATFAGLYQRRPMPAWLDATDWHAVRVTVSQTSARIEVAQGQRGYELVLDATLAHPPESLAMEFSLDNDNFPFPRRPITVPDGLDLRCVDIRYRPTALANHAQPSFCDLGK